MLVRAARFLISTPSAAVIALLAMVALGPENVWASCGDYVTVAGKKQSHDRPETTPPPCSQCPSKQSPGKEPCRGPHCSNDQPAPLPAPTTVERASENWAHFLREQLIPDQDPRFLAPGSDPLLLVRIPRSIFHPPRS